MPAAAIKMDELLVNWLGSDTVYENVLEWIETAAAQATITSQRDDVVTQLKALQLATTTTTPTTTASSSLANNNNNKKIGDDDDEDDVITATDLSQDDSSSSLLQHSNQQQQPIPPFYPVGQQMKVRRRKVPIQQRDTWEPLSIHNISSSSSGSSSSGNGGGGGGGNSSSNSTELPVRHLEAVTNITNTTTTVGIHNATGGTNNNNNNGPAQQVQQQQPSPQLCARDAAAKVFTEMGQPSSSSSSNSEDIHATFLTVDTFQRITKDVCRFPSYFNGPLFQRICDLWHLSHPKQQEQQVVTFEMLQAFWASEMEAYDATDRFFRLVKQISANHIVRDDFLPFIKALLQDHPGLEFLSTHAEFQEKYAVTVITRIFYTVNRCHSGRITSRQIRRSDLLQAFQQVDEEEDINKVTRYFSYEHFYVLYCRFWELDHDRDYRITREDLLKYGDHSLSHMIVDRIFDAAPRPFCTENKPNREYLSYEDFIYFMLSEEDKSNEVSVRYWFQCVDVDGDGKLNNMEMRSFYAVQLHRMQCMGHEIVPFEDMLCQMMDMIKPASTEYLVTEDFLQPECYQVSGALFDALFNLNKYLMFEQRDPFVERQKREDEFSTDWDRFACLDYNRLAMEEEAREEEAMEIDWVTVDDEEEDEDDDRQRQQQQQQHQDSGSSEAPF